MAAELAVLFAWPLLAVFVALPAFAAWRRRVASREASGVANDLDAFARELRGGGHSLPLPEALQSRLERLCAAEVTTLQLAASLPQGSWELLAEAAHRLATRLRRVAAFERKMLARTASGLRRGALAALLPAAGIALMQAFGLAIPASLLLMLWLAEMLGCLLLWRLARVEI